MGRRVSMFIAVVIAPGVICSVSGAADVTVRAINGKTGKPMAGYLVMLDGVDKTLYTEANVHRLSEAKTAPDGTATFHLNSQTFAALASETTTARSSFVPILLR